MHTTRTDTRSNALPLTAALLLWAAAACAPAGTLGRPCDLAAAPGPQQTAINADAPECDSRLCLKQPGDPSTPGARPFCTSSCQRDDDCGPNSPDTCPGGYTCAVAFETGPFAGKNLCLCRDARPSARPDGETSPRN